MRVLFSNIYRVIIIYEIQQVVLVEPHSETSFPGQPSRMGQQHIRNTVQSQSRADNKPFASASSMIKSGIKRSLTTEEQLKAAVAKSKMERQRASLPQSQQSIQSPYATSPRYTQIRPSGSKQSPGTQQTALPPYIPKSNMNTMRMAGQTRPTSSKAGTMCSKGATMGATQRFSGPSNMTPRQRLVSTSNANVSSKPKISQTVKHMNKSINSVSSDSDDCIIILSSQESEEDD